MAVMGLASNASADDALVGEGVYLRRPRFGDFAEWSRLRARSRSFLTPWEPTWASDELTRSGFRRRLRRYADDIRIGLCAPFFVFRSDDDVLVGGCNLNNIRRGVAQSAAIGYWIGEPYKRNGHIRAAVKTVTRYAFEEAGLHRLEAACIPSNQASRALLSGLGFREEGVARSYLKINGVWRDHVIYALLRDDQRAKRWPS